MEEFIQQNAEKVIGVMHGFDRVLFKGSILGICSISQLDIFLSSQRVLYKDFGNYAESLTRRVKAYAEKYAQEHGRPYEYLASPRESKEAKAKEILERDKVREGLICVLSCVQTLSYYLHRQRCSCQEARSSRRWSGNASTSIFTLWTNNLG